MRKARAPCTMYAINALQHGSRQPTNVALPVLVHVSFFLAALNHLCRYVVCSLMSVLGSRPPDDTDLQRLERGQSIVMQVTCSLGTLKHDEGSTSFDNKNNMTLFIMA